jgi:hypothetical protein
MGFVVSHPFARKKANGWGTGAFGLVRRGFISARNSLSRVKVLRMAPLGGVQDGCNLEVNFVDGTLDFSRALDGADDCLRFVDRLLMLQLGH